MKWKRLFRTEPAPEPAHTDGEVSMLGAAIDARRNGTTPPREDMLQWMERTGFVMDPDTEGESDA